MKKTKIIPIERTAEKTKHSGSTHFHIRHIFEALREHQDLLEDPDYKRLYDEAQDYLFRLMVKSSGWSKKRRDSAYSFLELLSDLNNASGHYTKYSIETVDSFLAERKKIWNA